MVLEELQTDQAQAVFRSHKVTLAYLYGSHARETALPTSDVDIAVLFRPDVDASEYSTLQISLITNLMSILKRNDVDVAVLNAAPPLLRYKAWADGKVVYCDSEPARIRYEVKAMLDYFDTKELRDVLAKAYFRRSA